MAVAQPPGLVGQVIRPAGGGGGGMGAAAGAGGGGGGGGGMGFVGGEMVALPLPIPRDRKKHKCSICGNITRAKCNFRACKNCCIEARNPCSVHKHFHPKSQNDGSGSVVSNANRVIPQWSASSSSTFSKTESFGKPVVGYIPMYHAIPQMYPQAVNLKVPSLAGIVNSSGKAASPAGTITKSSLHETAMAKEQQDSVRARNLRAALVASQKEAASVNAWRFQRVKEHKDSELATEDEAFDRYMQNASLLEEIFSTDGRPSENLSANVGTPAIHCPSEDNMLQENLSTDHDSEFLDAMNATLYANLKRKDIRKQKLKRAIARSLQKVKRGCEAADGYLDADDGSQFRLSDLYRDIKRIKVESKKGNDCLERMKAWDSLLQKVDGMKNMDDMYELVESYTTSFSNKIWSFFPDLIQAEEFQLASGNKCEVKEVASPHNVESAIANRADSAAILVPESLSGGESSERAGDLCHLGDDVMSNIQTNHDNFQAMGEEVEKIPTAKSTEQELISPAVDPTKKVNIAFTRNRAQNSFISDYHRFITGAGWWRVQIDEPIAEEMCKPLLNTADTFAEL